MHDESKFGIKFKNIVLCGYNKGLISWIAVWKTIGD